MTACIPACCHGDMHLQEAVLHRAHASTWGGGGVRGVRITSVHCNHPWGGGEDNLCAL